MGDNKDGTPNVALFTIGDSSDCDSVSTTTSNSAYSAIISPIRANGNAFSNHEAATTCCSNGNGNLLREHHYHVDFPAGIVDERSGENCTTLRGNGNRNMRLRLGCMGERFSNGIADIHLPVIVNLKTTTGHFLATAPKMAQNSSNGRVVDKHSSGIDMHRGEEERSIGCYSSRKWVEWRILIAGAIVQFISAMMISLQAPFYPAEAEKKGANAAEYGSVFGVFELTVFIVAPIYGSNIHKWNSQLVLHLGLFIAAISSIIFGLLDKIEDGNYFIAACALVRAVEAVGESAVVTASFIIVNSVFADNIASTCAFLEIFYSLGLVSGPIVGSFLYQVGGYSLPFMVVGGALLAAAILNFAILPSVKKISEFRSIDGEPVIISSYKSFRLLGSFPVFVSAACIVTGAMSTSYLQATLEPHLRQFQLSQLSVGAFMIINGAVYTITAPFWGMLCDKMSQLKLVAFCGSAILVAGYSLIGPVPFFSFAPTMWLVASGLALQGVGLGAVLIASCISIWRSVIRNGLPDTPSTYALVSSLWTSMFSLGSFIGPTLSGVLYDLIGFSKGTLSVIALCLLMMGIHVCYVCTSDAEMESFNCSENEPLIATSDRALESVGENLPSTSGATITHKRSNNSYGSI